MASLRPIREILEESYGPGVNSVYMTQQLGNRRRDRNMEGDPSYPIEAYCKLSIPFKAPDAPAIPSLDEIEKAMKDNNLDPQGFRYVCRIGSIVIKMGGPRVAAEAENMMYVKSHTEARVPKVYAVWTEDYVYKGEKDLAYYMAMEYIEGTTIDYNMDEVFTPGELDLLWIRLAEQLRLLRAAVPPEGPYYGRVHHQAFDWNLALTESWRQTMQGPYDTYEEFLARIYATAELCMATRHYAHGDPATDRMPGDGLPEFHWPYWKFLPLEERGPVRFETKAINFLTKFPDILSDHEGAEPTLTHLDLKLTNIIVKPLRGKDAEIVDWEVTLIDWETLVWLPKWLQVVQFHMRFFAAWKHRVRIFSMVEDTSSYQDKVDFLRESREQLEWRWYG